MSNFDFNMSEYSEPRRLAELIGPPPDYMRLEGKSHLEWISLQPGKHEITFRELKDAHSVIIQTLFDTDPETGLHSIKTEIQLGDGRTLALDPNKITVVILEEIKARREMEARNKQREQETKDRQAYLDATDFSGGLRRPIKAAKPLVPRIKL
jgi:hypothetical protein